jgi:hypothetical protein
MLNYSSLTGFLSANPGWIVYDTVHIGPVPGRFVGSIVTIAPLMAGGNIGYITIGWTWSAATFDAAYKAWQPNTFFAESALATTATGNPTATPPGLPVSLADTIKGRVLTSLKAQRCPRVWLVVCVKVVVRKTTYKPYVITGVGTPGPAREVKWKMAMRIMQKMAITITAVVIGFSVLQANASIDLNPTGSSPANSGTGTVQTWLDGLISSYNGANNPDLPYPVGNEAFRVNQGDATAPTGYPTFGANILSITLPGGSYNYVVLHWGGSGGGVYQAYFVGADTGSDTFNAPSHNGLSWYDTFTPVTAVPEPTTMIAGAGALGLALLGIGRGRRSSVIRVAH